MKITSMTISLPSADLVQSVEWFHSVFGASETIRPAHGIVELRLTSEIWLQYAQSSVRDAPAHIIRVGVDDLDVELAALSGAGISVGKPDSIDLSDGEVLRTACLLDPSGNRFCLYELKQKQ